MTDTTRTAPREPSSADSPDNQLRDRIATILAEHDGMPSDRWDQREEASNRERTLPRILAAFAEYNASAALDGMTAAIAADPNPPKWRQLLASRVLAEIPSRGNVTRDGDGNPFSTLDVAARIVATVVDVVGAADEILLQLDERNASTLAELRGVQRELGRLRTEHAQLGRDFDERCTAHHVTAIELERCRDELQKTRIELDRALERENDDRHEANERKD